MGGPGTIDYFPLTMSLVINQTPDIQEQIADLLAALRRLQDQEVAVEVRFISIADDFFERIGVNFNLSHQHQRTQAFQPQLTSTASSRRRTSSTPFRPNNFLAGSHPGRHADARTWTSRSPTTPIFGTDAAVRRLPRHRRGGLTMGLAFLSDIQVFLFMEAVQGDTRTNVMQAPKLTLFNGQTATLAVQTTQNFVTEHAVGVRRQR